MKAYKKQETPLKKNSLLNAQTIIGRNNYRRYTLLVDNVKIFDRSTLRKTEHRMLKKMFDELVVKHTKRHTKVIKHVEKW